MQMTTVKLGKPAETPPDSLKPIAGTVENPGSNEKFSEWAKQLLLGKSESALKFILFQSEPVELSTAKYDMEVTA